MKLRFAAGLVAALFGGVSLPAASTPASTPSANASRVLSIDHYVRVKSTAPSMPGQFAQLYVRERVAARHAEGGSAGVVLFIHGAGTPAEVAFDTPHPGYSWMAYLADAGFDVFAMDMEGYGRSTRPTAMNDPANLTPAQQAQFIPGLLAAPAAPSFQGGATTIASDWNDIAAVVAYLRSLRRVDRVSLVGWSQGGPRAGGYAAQHPEQIERLLLLAPAYARNGSATPPAAQPTRRSSTPRTKKNSRPTGTARSVARTSSTPRSGRRCGPTCSRPIPSAARGAPASGAPPMCRRGVTTRRWCRPPGRRRCWSPAPSMCR
ncbi:MAG: alpha/beta fold hydrolase [Opitutaceae bacterium]